VAGHLPFAGESQMLATIEAADASAAIEAAIKEFEIKDEARQKRLLAVRWA
jgi:hypothetical protein